MKRHRRHYHIYCEPLGRWSKVASIQSDKNIRAAVDGCLEHHVVLRIGQRWAPQVGQSNWFCDSRHCIENHFDVITLQSECLQLVISGTESNKR